MKCKNCEGTNITERVRLGHGTSTGNLGPKYQKGIFLGCEIMYVDICEDCGEINRLYVDTNKERKWLK